MKKILAVLVLAAAGAGVYQWSRPPALTESERRVRALEDELADVNAKIVAQERTAGRAGVAGSPALMELYDRRDRLQAEIAAARAAAPPSR